MDLNRAAVGGFDFAGYREQMIMTRWQNTLLCIASFALLACRSTKNYVQPDEPLYTGEFAAGPVDFAEVVKVVTWNIRFSEAIDQAVAELRSVEALRAADLLLLQEMDESGVDLIAQSLGYNYVYFPASVSRYHGRNFGNAILSRWPLRDPEKLILPHVNPNNGQLRTVTRAVAIIDERPVLVYSAHLESEVLEDDKRVEQVDAIVRSIDQDVPYVIAGGDFNTRSPESAAALEHRFTSAGLVRASDGTGPTALGSGMGFAVDHVFAREMVALDNGVYAGTRASDHYPVWVTMSFN